MYKQKSKSRLENSKYSFHSIKTSLILIITAVMPGMSNAVYNDNKLINGNQNHIEQEQKNK